MTPVVATESAIRDAIDRSYSGEGECADSIMQEFTDTQIDFSTTQGAPAGASFGDACFSSAAPNDEWSDAFELDDSGICQSAPPLFAPTPAPPRAVMRKSAPAPREPAALASSTPVVKLVDLMFAEAARLGATRILIVPHEDRVEVRYVINGKEVVRDSPPKRLEAGVIDRLATLANVTNPHDAVTNGSFGLTIHQREFNVAVEFTPGPHGTAATIELVPVGSSVD